MRHKAIIIIGDDTSGTQVRPVEVFRLLTDIHHHGNDGKKKDGEEKSGKEFLQYVPVEFLHLYKYTVLPGSIAEL